ncbi:unnamed protein product [Amoebophrya sp. A120]|nr:unnamed protein product [Amoebophrya sp. A120]|eukprot:GSA120T00017463001.1
MDATRMRQLFEEHPRENHRAREAVVAQIRGNLDLNYSALEVCYILHEVLTSPLGEPLCSSSENKLVEQTSSLQVALVSDANGDPARKLPLLKMLDHTEDALKLLLVWLNKKLPQQSDTAKAAILQFAQTKVQAGLLQCRAVKVAGSDKKESPQEDEKDAARERATSRGLSTVDGDGNEPTIPDRMVELKHNWPGDNHLFNQARHAGQPAGEGPTKEHQVAASSSSKRGTKTTDDALTSKKGNKGKFRSPKLKIPTSLVTVFCEHVNYVPSEEVLRHFAETLSLDEFVDLVAKCKVGLPRSALPCSSEFIKEEECRQMGCMELLLRAKENSGNKTFSLQKLADASIHWKRAGLALQPSLKLAQDWGMWRLPDWFAFLKREFPDTEDDAVLSYLRCKDMLAGANTPKVCCKVGPRLDLRLLFSYADVGVIAHPTSSMASTVDKHQPVRTFWVDAVCTKGALPLTDVEWAEYQVALDCEWWNPRPISLLQLAVRKSPTPGVVSDGYNTEHAGSRGLFGACPAETITNINKPIVLLFDLTSHLCQEVLHWLRKALLSASKCFLFSGAEDIRRLKAHGLLFPDDVDAASPPSELLHHGTKNNSVLKATSMKSKYPPNWLDLQLHYFPGQQPSLERVAESVLSEKLCKKVRESNWDRRPLLCAQIQYAARDAAVLFDLSDALASKHVVRGDEPSRFNSIIRGPREVQTETVLRDQGLITHQYLLQKKNLEACCPESNKVFHDENGEPFGPENVPKFCAHNMERKLIRKFRGLGIDILEVEGRVTALKPLPGRVLLLRDPLLGKRNKIEQMESESAPSGSSCEEDGNEAKNQETQAAPAPGAPDEAALDVDVAQRPASEHQTPPTGPGQDEALDVPSRPRNQPKNSEGEQNSNSLAFLANGNGCTFASEVGEGEWNKGSDDANNEDGNTSSTTAASSGGTPGLSTSTAVAAARVVEVGDLTTKKPKVDKVNPVSFIPNVYTIQAGPKIIDMVLEVVRFFEMQITAEDFCNRCVDCNASDWQLVTDKMDIKGDVEEAVFENQSVFYRCGGCRKVYWEGHTFEKACSDLEVHFPSLKAEEVRGFKAQKLMQQEGEDNSVAEEEEEEQ